MGEGSHGVRFFLAYCLFLFSVTQLCRTGGGREGGTGFCFPPLLGIVFLACDWGADSKEGASLSDKKHKTALGERSGFVRGFKPPLQSTGVMAGSMGGFSAGVSGDGTL